MQVDLIYARNVLKKGDCNEDVKRIIKTIMDKAEGVSSPVSNLYKQVCQNSLEDILNKDYVSAGYELNLIHNMPLNGERWDEEHFYLYELPVYFENSNSAKRVKKMLLLISEIIKRA